ncbi:MAG: EAL domain-containing response regulator [Nitrosomonas sp.]|nr:EAL domain-containing response regulator [Nitrosomonas sp.]
MDMILTNEIGSLDLPDEVKSTRVMLVDDDEFMLDYLENLLRGLGVIDIVRAKDGRSALDLIDASDDPPQLLFCDLVMPKMDGIEFFRHLAARQFKGAIIIASGSDRGLLNGMQRLLDRHQLKSLGVLYKPIDEKILISVLLKSSVASHINDEEPAIYQVTPEEIRVGLTTDRLETFFQPKISISKNKVIGVECLARWNHPEHGLLLPSAFISVAESNDLIDDLTIILFRKAMQYLSDWTQQGHASELVMGVNFSMESLGRLDLPDILAGIVEQHNLEAEQIVLEMTESRLLDNMTAVLEVAGRIRLKGFGLSLDDFGTGYSNIEKLRLLPLTELKIDRSFVHGASEDVAASSVLESCMRIGRALGMKIVAEGVENQVDLDLVTAAGCNAVQGNFIAKPMCAEEFIAWKMNWEQ